MEVRNNTALNFGNRENVGRLLKEALEASQIAACYEANKAIPLANSGNKKGYITRARDLIVRARQDEDFIDFITKPTAIEIETLGAVANNTKHLVKNLEVRATGFKVFANILARIAQINTDITSSLRALTESNGNILGSIRAFIEAIKPTIKPNDFTSPEITAAFQKTLDSIQIPKPN